MQSPVGVFRAVPTPTIVLIGLFLRNLPYFGKAST